MKKIYLFICAAIMLGTAQFSSLQAQTDTVSVTFVSGGGVSHTKPDSIIPVNAKDTALITVLKKRGMKVYTASDNQCKLASSTADSVAALRTAINARINKSDIILISSTVGGSNAGAATILWNNAKSIPVLDWEYATAVCQRMGMSNGLTLKDPVDSMIVFMPGVEEDTQLVGKVGSPFQNWDSTPNLEYAKYRVLGGDSIVSDLSTIQKWFGPNDTTGCVYFFDQGNINYKGQPTAIAVCYYGLFSHNDAHTITTDAGLEIFMRTITKVAGKLYDDDTNSIAAISTLSNINTKVWFTNGNLNIDLQNDLTGSMVSVYDINGKLVAEERVNGTGLMVMPLGNIESGMYIVRGDNFSSKFIKY